MCCFCRWCFLIQKQNLLIFDFLKIFKIKIFFQKIQFFPVGLSLGCLVIDHFISFSFIQHFAISKGKSSIHNDDDDDENKTTNKKMMHSRCLGIQSMKRNEMKSKSKWWKWWRFLKLFFLTRKNLIYLFHSSYYHHHHLFDCL